MKPKLEMKVINLIHQLGYIQRVYPRSNIIYKLKCRIYYYNKKIN